MSELSIIKLKRAYSSGSVQDLHLIPFSAPFPERRKDATKTGGKYNTNLSKIIQMNVEILFYRSLSL
jgi:hypothetical protein